MQSLLGVRVLDFTRLLPGPYATRVLGELGAEVVKIESMPDGDPVRQMPPMIGATGVSSVFSELNRGKASVALDFQDARDRARLFKLASSADVLVDGFRPGILERLGLGIETMMRANPRLVYAAVTGFGLFGPDKDRRGHDLGFMARAGATALTGTQDAPGVVGVQVADVGASWILIAGILAALFERERTGRGKVIDVSLFEAALPFAVTNFGRIHGGVSVGRGTQPLDGSRPCYGIYATRDGKFLAVAALEPKFWTSFVEAIGLVHLDGHGHDLGEAGEKVRHAVASRLRERTQAEWMSLLGVLDCCVEPVVELADVDADPHLRARNMFESDATGRVTMVRAPIHGYDSWPFLAPPAPHPTADAPALGADTERILGAWGVDDGSQRD